MKKLLRGSSLAILFMAILHITGCSTTEKMEEARGYIWSAKKGDNEVKLIGTMHPAPKSHVLLTNDIKQVLINTDVLSVEADITNTANTEILKNSSYLEDGDYISNYLSSEELNKLQEIIKETNLEIEDIKSFNPSGLMQVISGLSYSKSDFTGAPLDSLMIDFAKTNSINVNELEGVDFQINVLNKLYNWDFVKNVIKSYSAENIKSDIDYTNEMFKYYVAGDDITPIKIIEEQKKESPEMYQILTVDRNVKIVEKIEDLVKNNNKNTIAIGYLHFIGEDSILEMLKSKGYTITKWN